MRYRSPTSVSSRQLIPCQFIVSMLRYANFSGADEIAYPFKEFAQAIFSNSADAVITITRAFTGRAQSDRSACKAIVSGDPVGFNHKVRLSIAGCLNYRNPRLKHRFLPENRRSKL